MSISGDFVEANKNIYDYLRIAETEENGEFVLLTNIDQIDYHEMKDSMYDRIFRAVTGTQIHMTPDLKKYKLSSV